MFPSALPRRLCFLWLLSPTPWQSMAWATEIFRWVDEKGGVHFGDRARGPGAEPVAIETGERPEATQRETARLARTQRLLGEYAAERAEKTAARERTAAARAERRERCAEARRLQQELVHSAFLYTRDEEGNRVILPDTELARRREAAASQVEQICGEPR